MNCGTTGSLAGFVCGQPYPYENGFCEFGGGRHVTCPACPYGGTVSASGDTCEFAPPCPSGQVRDPKTGKCDLTQPQKTVGNPVDTNVCVGDPCNAGTGTEFEVQALLRSGATAPLVEQLSYNSRVLSDASSIWTGAYGKGWKGHYERRVVILSTGVAVVGRSDGRELDFQPPSSGNVYVADADVADRLERLTDGGGSTTGWKYVVASDDSTELYGPTGNLLSISDRAGSTQTLTYSDVSTPPNVAPAPGLLITVSDAWGRTLGFIYDSQNRIVRMTDPAGGNYNYAYDTAGNLASITFPDTKVRSYVYNEPENTQNTALPNTLTGIIDVKATLDYTSPFVSTTVTDALGVARSYGLTVLLGVVKGTGISGPACPTCGPATQTYDGNGNVASRTDWNGNRTNYVYDLARNLETSRIEGLTSAGGTTPQTRTVSTEWDANFRLPTRVAEPLRITTNVYDPDGSLCGARGALCSKSIQATTDANGAQGLSGTPSGAPRSWTYTYNGNGSPLTVKGPRTDVSDLTTYTYYANNAADLGKRGNVATITNAAGHLTSITAYNALGQPLTIIDSNGMTITLGYDARQRLTSRNSGGEVTSYGYDGVGQLTKVTLPDGSFLSYSYDAAHRLTGMQNNLGNTIAYTLDAMGNRTLEQVFDPANALARTRSR